jgi:NAD-dependent dihydropyrimidine dehydrogenase PreA subunit
MAEKTVYCEECVEEIPASEVYWDDGRLYCGRCGSEVEAPDRDIFEEIVDNRTGFLFRDQTLEEVDEDDAEEEEDGGEEIELDEEDGAAGKESEVED